MIYERQNHENWPTAKNNNQLIKLSIAKINLEAWVKKILAVA